MLVFLLYKVLYNTVDSESKSMNIVCTYFFVVVLVAKANLQFI